MPHAPFPKRELDDGQPRVYFTSTLRDFGILKCANLAAFAAHGPFPEWAQFVAAI